MVLRIGFAIKAVQLTRVEETQPRVLGTMRPDTTITLLKGGKRNE